MTGQKLHKNDGQGLALCGISSTQEIYIATANSRVTCGRCLRMSETTKERIIKFRVSETDYQKIMLEAEHSNMNVSEYIRSLVLAPQEITND